jgi:hypothetical protein
MADYCPPEAVSDFLKEHFSEEAGAWMLEKIREQEQRHWRRRDAEVEILRRSFGCAGPVSVDQIDPSLRPLYYELVAWLPHIPTLLRGLLVSFGRPRIDSIVVEMSIVISGRVFAYSDHIEFSQPVDVILNRCYERLLKSLGTELEML